MVKAARWRAAGCTNLITRVDLNSVGLCKQYFEAVGEHGAADVWCCSFRRPAVPLDLCASERSELVHVLRTHDEASVRSSHRVRSDVCVS